MPALVITADDLGYAPAYDAGIAEAARAGAIDGASAMVLRGELDPGLLEGAAVAVGLHLELDRGGLAEQVARFEAVFGREPDYLDGHHHCHARGRPAVEVANLARERGFPVRSVDARHRRLLRCKGVATADRLVGRYSERDPVVPPEIEAAVRGEGIWEGVVEWVTHPGHAARDGASSYDAGREEDLRVLLELAEEPRLRAVRAGWRDIAGRA
ncbi:MAG TPA: ChbG/HpnK family deacetylase [Solirubrobacterales bacterium]